MTIDLRILKGRDKNFLEAISTAGKIWLIKTFTVVRNHKVGFDPEDTADMVKIAKGAGMTIDE